MSDDADAPIVKKDARVILACSQDEKKAWENAFGFRRLSRTARLLLNAAAAQKTEAALKARRKA